MSTLVSKAFSSDDLTVVQLWGQGEGTRAKAYLQASANFDSSAMASCERAEDFYRGVIRTSNMSGD